MLKTVRERNLFNLGLFSHKKFVENGRFILVGLIVTSRIHFFHGSTQRFFKIQEGGV